jgi:hypothetical protein
MVYKKIKENMMDNLLTNKTRVYVFILAFCSLFSLLSTAFETDFNFPATEERFYLLFVVGFFKGVAVTGILGCVFVGGLFLKKYVTQASASLNELIMGAVIIGGTYNLLTVIFPNRTQQNEEGFAQVTKAIMNAPSVVAEIIIMWTLISLAIGVVFFMTKLIMKNTN